MAETETDYISVLDDIETVLDWQEENPHCCARCGVEYDRPLNRSKHDRRILLCDGCVFIDTVLYSPDVITKGKEQTAADFWDADEWVAFRPLATPERKTYPDNCLIVRKYDKQGKMFSEEVAATQGEAIALVEASFEAYDSDIEGKAEVRLVYVNEDGNKTSEPYTIGYCQRHRDWEDFIEKFDLYGFLDKE